MILYRRRIDYRALLLLTTGITIIPEGEVPEEEYNTIPEALEVLEEVHSIIKNFMKP